MLKSFNKFFIILISFFNLLIFCFLLTSCSPINPDEVIQSLLPNLWVFLSHIFATIVLLSMSVWLIWKPTKDSLKKRNEYIQDQINQADFARKESLKRLAEAEKEKMNAHSHAQSIVDIASSQAYQIKDKIENEAKNNAKKITEDAINEGIKIKTNIYSTMDKQIMDIAFDATSLLLKKKISKKDNDRFVKDFINQLKNEETK